MKAPGANYGGFLGLTFWGQYLSCWLVVMTIVCEYIDYKGTVPYKSRQSSAQFVLKKFESTFKI